MIDEVPDNFQATPAQTPEDAGKLRKYAIKAWVPTEGDPNSKQTLMGVIQLDIALSVFAAEQTKLLDLLYWKYKELNGQSVDLKFVEAYNQLKAELNIRKD